jgi:DNA invertase Pin-like site-specific DNA recombinase
MICRAVSPLDELRRTSKALYVAIGHCFGTGARHDRAKKSQAILCLGGKLIMTVFAGIAEFERDLIRERTSAGRDAARGRVSASDALES